MNNNNGLIIIVGLITTFTIIVIGAFMFPSHFGLLGEKIKENSLVEGCFYDNYSEDCDDLVTLTGCKYFNEDECIDLMID